MGPWLPTTPVPWVHGVGLVQATTTAIHELRNALVPVCIAAERGTLTPEHAADAAKRGLAVAKSLADALADSKKPARK